MKAVLHGRPDTEVQQRGQLQAGRLHVALTECLADLSIGADGGHKVGRADSEVQAKQRLKRDGHRGLVDILHAGGFTVAVCKLNRGAGLDGLAGLEFLVPCVVVVCVHVAQHGRGVVSDAQNFVGDDLRGSKSVCHFQYSLMSAPVLLVSPLDVGLDVLRVRHA